MAEHFEEHERHFNSVPAVRFTGIVNPFKAEITVSWTYNFGPSQVGPGPVHACIASIRALRLRVHVCMLPICPSQVGPGYMH